MSKNRGYMSKETFIWKTLVGTAANVQPRIKTIKFGDGYEQRIQDGINHDLRSYPVTIIDKSDVIIWAENFLKRHAGYKAFLWRETITHKLILVKCQSWTVKNNGLTSTITATFEEVVA